MSLISVSQARQSILQKATSKGTETAPLKLCAGRVLASDIHARRTQPPFTVSAMDGYGVQSADAVLGKELTVCGEAPAGKPFSKTVMAGQAVRIFTGSILPKGTDHVVIQEDVRREGAQIIIDAAQNPPRHIRPAGQDFQKGELLLPAGRIISALDLSLLAAGGISEAEVYKRPKIAIFCTGDELEDVGDPLTETSIVASTPLTLIKWFEQWGGDASYLGIARDNYDSLSAILEKARTADVIVPIGGASVGDYDLVKTAFERAGYQVVFSKVAIRPGKPVWFGRWHSANILGLPGNPASALVCAQIFARPLIQKLTGIKVSADLKFKKARLTEDMPANGPRARFDRGRYALTDQGIVLATPQKRQDSSMITVFTASNCLIHHAPHAKDTQKGDLCDVLTWDNSDLG